MNVTERAKVVAERVSETCVYHYEPALNVEGAAELIEQALLAERRLAMEEAAKIADAEAARNNASEKNVASSILGIPFHFRADGMRETAAKLRAAAEKEVGAK